MKQDGNDTCSHRLGSNHRLLCCCHLLPHCPNLSAYPVPSSRRHRSRLGRMEDLFGWGFHAHHYGETQSVGLGTGCAMRLERPESQFKWIQMIVSHARESSTLGKLDVELLARSIQRVLVFERLSERTAKAPMNQCGQKKAQMYVQVDTLRPSCHQAEWRARCSGA